MPDAFAPGRHERRVARRLEARGDPGLGEILTRLSGCEVGGRWRIESLYAVGAEGAVYLATDLRSPDAPVRVAKVPLYPFHRPAQLSSNFVRLRRQGLREEAEKLARSASPYMPVEIDTSDFANPLLDRSRGGAFLEPDPVLVMERLPGIDVDRWISRVHRSRIARPVVRQHLDRVVVVLLQALHDLTERGFYYADLRPGNLRMIGRPARRVRLLDAGSLVEIGDRSGRFPHAPHYLPPELFSVRHKLDLPIVPSAAAQAVMAGRTLFEIATGHVPVPGEPVRAADLRDACVSPPVADVVDGLAAGSFETVLHALRYLSRRAVRRVHSGPAPAPEATPAVAAPAAPTPEPPPAPRGADDVRSAGPKLGPTGESAGSRAEAAAIPEAPAPTPSADAATRTPVRRRSGLGAWLRRLFGR